MSAVVFSPPFNFSLKRWAIAIEVWRRRLLLIVGAITRKVFHVSSSNLLCMLLISSSRTISITAEKIFKMADLLRFDFFAFYVNNFTLWTR